MDKKKSMTIDTIPGLRALTLSPDYRNALKLPEEPAEEYEMLAQGEYNINFRFRHPVTGEKLVLRVNSESQMHLENQIEYEGNALKLLENSGRTPVLKYIYPGDEQLTRGALVMSFLPGRALDYSRASELEEAAKSLAEIHCIPVDETDGLIEPEAPIRAILEECEEMFATYWESEMGAPDVKNRIRRLLDEGWKRIQDGGDYTGYKCCVNTELNNTNFLVEEETGTVRLVDWEKPLYSDPAQDLGHFLAPTTTFWKTDVIFENETIEKFIDTYIEAVENRYDTIGLRARTMEFIVITCLRGLTWCAMAWVQYRQNDKGLTNESTRVKLDAYLTDEFLRRIEAIYGI